MRTYRYPPDSIDRLCRTVRKQHFAAFTIFTAVFCAAGFSLFQPRSAALYAVLFSGAVGITAFRTRNRGRQRTAGLLRSVEFEIDDEKISHRSNLGRSVIYRSEVTEASFSEKGIWLRGKSRRVLQLPPELEDFNELQTHVQEWLSPDVVRRNSSPPGIWITLRIYGMWIGAAILLYVSMTSETATIAVPACILAGTGVAWYFLWCGRRINERTWKVLFPTIGCLFAAVMLGRAITLWGSR